MAPSHKYNDVDPAGDESHQIISSYFMGPKAENFEFFKQSVVQILEAQRDARLQYFPDDGVFISEGVKSSDAFVKSTEKIRKALQQASYLMGKHSIPFWSPRYQGHMCMDLSMPALLGYFMTMIYNPNNVSIEASPITTVAEIQVGEDLCKMFGFNVNPEHPDPEEPVAWGHIACDGSVANLESMWAARNLKFYPLSLRTAMDGNGPLSFIANDFKVEKCNGDQEIFMKLKTWELLNLKPKTILDIPERLYQEYRIAPGFLDGVMKTYGVQFAGKSEIEKAYEIKEDMKYFTSATKHYSWPKGAAITGIGASNVIGIEVDDEARVDVEDLDKKLKDCLDNEVGVYAVVAIIGSTEEGSVDPLFEIIQLREKYQKLGLSFLVHGDAAWGGYFVTMIPDDYKPGGDIIIPIGMGNLEGFVPDASLRAKTSQDLYMLRFADSVTIDPHKAAYIPYPAGGLCYRDGRMRYLLTFTSPYISRGETTATSIGVFGVEGSKPGASVMSTWFSNACIGLNNNGYGKLLGEVTFTCSRLSAEWAAMHNDDDPFIVVPLNLLPSEKVPGGDIETDRKRIKDKILSKTNTNLVEEDAKLEDPKDRALPFLRELGSDLNINAFSTNWRYKGGELNDEVEEANYYNWLVIQDLSVDSPEDEPDKIPFYLTSTTFMRHEYGRCVQNFKRRLGLFQDEVDLVVMRNVVMSPWPTDGNYISELIVEFRKALVRHVDTMRKRNDTSASIHTFLLLGFDKLYAVHFPMFHLEKHRRQLIIEVSVSEEAKNAYLKEQEKDPAGVFVLKTDEEIELGPLVSEKKTFKGSLAKRCPVVDPGYHNHFDDEVVFSGIDITVSNIIKDKSLKGRFRDASYPTNIVPFYLFGTKDCYVIDHVLVKSPNIQLSADDVKLNLDNAIPEDQLAKGCVLTVDGYSEAAMQPFQSTEGSLSDTLGRESDFFFSPGKVLKVSVYEDTSDITTPGPGLLDGVLKLNGKEAKLLAKGEMTLSVGRFVDSAEINEDPFAAKEGSDKYKAWKEQFDSIGKELV